MPQKTYALPLLLAAGICALPLLLLSSGWLDAWERGAFDLLCRMNLEEDEVSDRVSLILIDNKSLEWGADYYERFEEITGDAADRVEYGPDTTYLWPWKRSAYETIIDFLARGGARVIAFDMVFSDPHPSGDALSDFSLGGTTLLMNEEGRTSVIHTINFRTSENPPVEHLNALERRVLEAASVPIEGIAGSVYPFDRSDQGFYYGPILPYRSIVIDALDAVEDPRGLLKLGAVVTQIDSDSVIRRARPLAMYRQWVFPSLGLAAACAFLGNARLRVEKEGLYFDRSLLPLTPEGDLLVHWKDTGQEGYGGGGRFKTYPAYRILLSAMEDARFLEAFAEDPKTFRVDPREFEGRIVFIGANALGLYDLKATPVSENYPGVKVHAAVAENVLDADPLQRLAFIYRAAAVLVLALLVFLATISVNRAVLKFALFIGIATLYLAGVGALFGVAV